MFLKGIAKLSTHMKVQSQSNRSHMPESSDSLFFFAWGETDLASVGVAGGRVARTPATGYCTTDLDYGCGVKPMSPAGRTQKSLSGRSKHGSAHNCSWHPGQSREWWVGKIFTLWSSHLSTNLLSVPLYKVSRACLWPSRKGINIAIYLNYFRFKQISAHEGTTQVKQNVTPQICIVHHAHARAQASDALCPQSFTGDHRQMSKKISV